MARPLRIEYEGALYHVTSRGNAREAIFVDDEDRHTFLAILAKVVARYRWLCHAYCLMDNHYHLMIETPDGNLSLGMRQLNGLYTQTFNRRHGRVGHVFQGRFKAILVDKNSYCLELCRYVVLNPARAKRVKAAKEYRWSSYRATAGLAPAPGFLTRAWLLRQFGRARREAEAAYRRFVAEGVPSASPWAQVSGQVLLGSPAFRGGLARRLKASETVKEIPRRQRLAASPPLAVLFPKTGFRTQAARNRRIRRAHLEYGYTLSEIARQLGLHYTTISKIVDARGQQN